MFQQLLRRGPALPLFNRPPGLPKHRHQLLSFDSRSSTGFSSLVLHITSDLRLSTLRPSTVFLAAFFTEVPKHRNLCVLRDFAVKSLRDTLPALGSSLFSPKHRNTVSSFSALTPAPQQAPPALCFTSLQTLAFRPSDLRQWRSRFLFPKHRRPPRSLHRNTGFRNTVS